MKKTLKKKLKYVKTKLNKIMILNYQQLLYIIIKRNKKFIK
jgi:hypothetical protein